MKDNIISNGKPMTNWDICNRISENKKIFENNLINILGCCLKYCENIYETNAARHKCKIHYSIRTFFMEIMTSTQKSLS